MLDYARYDMGPRAEPVILLRCEAYERNLYKHLVSLKGPMHTRHYVAWAYQVRLNSEFWKTALKRIKNGTSGGRCGMRWLI